MKSLNEIIAQFPEVGKVGEIIPLTAGLINQTYKVQTEDPEYRDTDGYGPKDGFCSSSSSEPS